MVEEWIGVARRLSDIIQPGRLRLSLVCNTPDRTSAEDIVRPLLQIPVSAECAVRLGQAPNHDQRRLAESTVLRVTKSKPSNAPF